MGAVDSPRWPVEGGLEAVSGGVVLHAPPSVKRFSDGGVVVFDLLQLATRQSNARDPVKL
jgi:hypothetical protein